MTGHHIASYRARVTTSSNLTPRRYELRIDGHLDARWTASFDGMTLALADDGTTSLRGTLPDQAALHGLLARVRDAGLPLLSVAMLDDEPSGLMRAAVYRRFGGPEVVAVEQVPRPTAAPGQLLIRVRATTVSAADHRTRSRDIPAGLRLPSSLVIGFFRPRRRILGMEAAGTVVSVGAGVTAFAPGDDVVAMLGSGFGAHAEYAVVDAAGAVVAKPAGMTFEDAAALVFGGITARAFLRQATVSAGTRVLVNGASGAVGSAAVQLAKAAGAVVTGVTSAGNAALVRSLGADRVVDYATQDFTADGAVYDVVVDCVGNAPVDRIQGILAPGATVLLVAADLRSLLTARNRSRRLGITVVTAPGPYRAEDLGHVTALAERGTLRPVVERTFPLTEIVEAHRVVDGNRKRGSVVLTMPAI